jgi:hypothetical protein
MEPCAKTAAKTRRLAILILCAAILAIWPGRAAAEEPLDALILAQKGIDSMDPGPFHQAVDLEAIMARGLDAAVNVLLERTRESAPLDPFLALIVRGLIEGSPQTGEFLKSFLVSETRTFINAGISRGVFAGNSKGDPGFSPLFEGISPGRKEILPGKVLSRKGGRATVSATLLDHGAGRFPLRLAVENAGGRWRITEILNVPELIRAALRHER